MTYSSNAIFRLTKEGLFQQNFHCISLLFYPIQFTQFQPSQLQFFQFPVNGLQAIGPGHQLIDIGGSSSNLIGATTLEQLRENIASVDVQLSDELIAKINAIHHQTPNPAP